MNLENKYKKIKEEYEMCVLNFKKIPIEKIARIYNKSEHYIKTIIERNRYAFNYSLEDSILGVRNESYYSEEEMLMSKPVYNYSNLSLEEKVIYIESEQEEGPIKFNQLIKYDG